MADIPTLEPAQNVPLADEEARPRSSKLWIIIALAVLAAGAGSALWYYLGASHKTAKDAPAAKVYGPALYVSLDPPFVTNFEVGLAPEDEPFLEAALDDGRKEVRTAAAARLETTRRPQRMRIAINIGPNKETPPERIADDYAALALFGAFLGLGVLAKGPAAVILAGGAIALWALTTKQWRAALRAVHPLAVATFCVVTLPWYVLCALRNPDFTPTGARLTVTA